MSDQIIQRAITEARDLSIQDRAKGGLSTSASFFPQLVEGSYLVPPWWSEARDRELRRFWKTSDHLSGAIYNMTSKMTAIPFKVVAKNPSNRTHREQAAYLQDVLLYGADYGEGWQTFYTKFIEDLLTQDKGCFAEIIGPGPITGPIQGAPISIAHLDAAACQRTGHPEWPIIFRDNNGDRRKIHYTRVIFGSQMASPRQEMFGVGFSAVSRCLSVAQTLIDILNFKMEKLGSRPHRAILLTKGGLDPDQVAEAFATAASIMDSKGLSRYAMMVVIGSVSLPEAGLEKIDLASLPDGFDEETSVTYGMATIALALGVDARELFPAMSAGATRADALLQHIKQRGKGPGQIIGTVEQLFNFKFLPPHLKFVFDQQDDAEDHQAAEIAQVRAQARERDLIAGILTVRSARQRMLADGEINDEQFATMELQDGRLSDGTSILSLLYSDDPVVAKLLAFSVEQPDNVTANDPLAMLEEIDTKLSLVHQEQAQTRSYPQRVLLAEVEAALIKLQSMYSERQTQDQQQMQTEMEMAGIKMPKTMRSDRPGTINKLAPNPKTELDPTGGGDTMNVRRNATKSLDDQIAETLARVDRTLTTLQASQGEQT